MKNLLKQSINLTLPTLLVLLLGVPTQATASTDSNDKQLSKQPQVSTPPH